MKKILAVYAIILLLFQSQVSKAEVESLLQTYPTFNADYGFTEYYDALKVEQGGLFRIWSVQSKAQLSEMLPTLCQMEVDRMKTFHPEFLTDLSLLSSLMRQRYGIPDDAAMTENDAIQLAREWMQNHTEQGNETVDQCTAYTAYLIDGTAQWAVSFYDKGSLIAETRMDAHSCVFSQIGRVTAEQMVFAQSEALGAPSAFSLRDLFARATYDFKAQVWTFNYYTDPFDAGVNYHVDEVQMVAIPGSNG